MIHYQVSQEAKYICLALTIAMIVMVAFGSSYFVTAGENKLSDLIPNNSFQSIALLPPKSTVINRN